MFLALLSKKLRFYSFFHRLNYLCCCLIQQLFFSSPETANSCLRYSCATLCSRLSAALQIIYKVVEYRAKLFNSMPCHDPPYDESNLCSRKDERDNRKYPSAHMEHSGPRYSKAGQEQCKGLQHKNREDKRPYCHR